MDDFEDIPAFLRLTEEERREAWRAHPPKPWPKFKAARKDEEPATRALRKELETAARKAERAKKRDKAERKEELARQAKHVPRIPRMRRSGRT